MNLTPQMRPSFVPRRSGVIPVIFAAILFASSLAHATDNYAYGPDEYVTVAQGISPDGKFAITAHSEGEYPGYKNFHLYLTDAASGKTIGSLEEVQPILDTGAGAYVAKWSIDSKKVLIIWRWSRHDPFLSITYRLEGKRAVPLTKAPVNSDQYGKLWSKNCSEDHPTPRRFGTARTDNKGDS